MFTFDYIVEYGFLGGLILSLSFGFKVSLLWDYMCWFVTIPGVYVFAFYFGLGLLD